MQLNEIIPQKSFSIENTIRKKTTELLATWVYINSLSEKEIKDNKQSLGFMFGQIDELCETKNKLKLIYDL